MTQDSLVGPTTAPADASSTSPVTVSIRRSVKHLITLIPVLADAQACRNSSSPRRKVTAGHWILSSNALHIIGRNRPRRGCREGAQKAIPRYCVKITGSLSRADDEKQDADNEEGELILHSILKLIIFSVSPHQARASIFLVAMEKITTPTPF